MEDYTAEMIKDMAFSFCPQCGAAIVPNHRGRPRKFCSPECRSKWNNTHLRPQNWKTVRSKVCPMCGREFSYRHQYERENYLLIVADRTHHQLFFIFLIIIGVCKTHSIIAHAGCVLQPGETAKPVWAFFVSEIFYFQQPVTCVRPDP